MYFTAILQPLIHSMLLSSFGYYGCNLEIVFGFLDPGSDLSLRLAGINPAAHLGSSRKPGGAIRGWWWNETGKYFALL